MDLKVVRKTVLSGLQCSDRAGGLLTGDKTGERELQNQIAPHVMRFGLGFGLTEVFANDVDF